jgi:hypothetical protein
VINLMLIAWQLLTGFRVIRVSLRTHQKTGIALAVSAVVHAGMALLA